MATATHTHATNHTFEFACVRSVGDIFDSAKNLSTFVCIKKSQYTVNKQGNCKYALDNFQIAVATESQNNFVSIVQLRGN